MLPPDLHFCVLIPVYNNPEGLLRSLFSIRYDKEKHLVVIVDDGSREPITDQMLEAAALPSPFHLIRLPQNRGITEALNTGLRWIQEHTDARYVARLDCSDTCHPERLTRQVAFLDSHPEVGLLGTWCTFRSEDGTYSYPYTTPVTHEEIGKEMHRRNVFIHPTVMFRVDLLKRVGVYPYNYPHAEDYALFWSMIAVMKSAILDQSLVTCSINPGGISMGNRKAQLNSRIKVVKEFGKDRKGKVLNFIKIKMLLFIPQSVLLWYKKARYKD
ncbi:MAG TPA: glycosyltransferase [Verrucomicrobiae bacterium]|nr:glycosyltransferase [Verrucomicrobiae bacterium]